MHFAERHRAQARVVAATAERLLPPLTRLLDWKPASRIELVVLDSADFANGLAAPLPFNLTMIFLSPPDEGELLQNRDWLELVLAHELFHVVHLDKARDDPLGLRRVFGRLPFVFPNLLQPRWIIEGLAVHAESGRLGNSYYEAMMRAEASRGFRSLSELNADGRRWPLNRNYLYGGYFFAFMEERYGRKAIADFIESYSDNIVPFRVHSNPVAATGKNMDALWGEYAQWLRARFFAHTPAPREGALLAKAWSLTSPVLASDGARWYVSADGYTRPKLMREGKAVREVELDSRLAAASDGGVLLAEADICSNYNYYYGLSRVMPDGTLRRLADCSRMRFAAGADVGVRVDGGQPEVVTLAGEVLYRAAPGESITGVAARGSSIVLTRLREGAWSLVAIDAGKAQVLVSDGAIKHSPRFGERGEIFFVADYGSVFNVWSLAPSGRLARWTEAAHGVREASAPHQGEILLTTIEADGDALRLYRLPDSPLEERTGTAAVAPARQPTASIEAPDRAYSPWRSLAPRSWLPVLEIAEGAFKAGVLTFGADALLLHQYIAAPQYEFTQDEPLGYATYIYDQRHLLLVDRAMRVRESSDNEIQAYTIEEEAQWVSTWRHLRLNRRFYWGFGGALERERLRRVGAGSLEAQDERVLGLVAGVDTRRAQWLSEGPSQGQQLRLFAENSYGSYSGQVYRADWRLHFPAGKTVLSLRWNEAWADPAAEPFQLGGSDTDPPLLLPILNQRDFALRGYSSGEPTLAGHRARLGTLEWRVPLADIDRHAMVPPAGLNRVALNLFFDAGDAWPRGGSPDYHRGYGLELMAEIRLGYLFVFDLRLGAANGRDEGGRTSAYLRLGRSF